MGSASSDVLPGRRYVGRFAPSPTGPLHAGSMVAALASWLDAEAHHGQWLVRIEDVDLPRCVPGAEQIIMSQLADVALLGRDSATPLRQSARGAAYEEALSSLTLQRWTYPCGCSRRDIEAAQLAAGRARPRHGELLYPGTCRPEHGGLAGKPARALRLRVVEPEPEPAPEPTSGELVSDIVVDWHDRLLGAQSQNITEEVGDFVLHRADGLWAYQLAVVVDDAAQGITCVVRGRDLADNTARQIHLQRLLGFDRPAYAHTPLVLGANGEKLSKQNGAAPADSARPLDTLSDAARVLGLEPAGVTAAEVLATCVRQWASLHKLASFAA